LYYFTYKKYGEYLMIKVSVAASLALVALSMVGCGSSSDDKSKSVAQVSAIEFAPVALAANDAEKKQMRVSEKVTVTYSDNTKKEYPLTYKTLMKMGDTIGQGKIGLITDENGNPIKKSDGSEDISDGPDGNSLIHVGDKDYLITHMEERPGELYKTEVKVEDYELKAVNTEPVDLKGVGGTIINCASTKTAYGSHLGGEEDYSLNSIFADSASPFYADCALDGSGNDVDGKFNYFCSYVDGMAKYLGDSDIDKSNGYNGSKFSPYNYGYIVEVQPQADGTTKSAKHYVTGKYTPELAAMMPDGKTVYMSDDGTAKGFWKFVSDKKITDFTANWEGTLYSAKVSQTSAENGGSFDLTWVELGHAKDSEIKTMIDSKMKLTDIFEIAKPDENGTCETGFTSIFEDSKFECLKIKTGKEKEAAFLETRKFAAYKGATIEFRKEEGLTYDPDRNALYVAMSAVEKSMEDNYKGLEPANDIRLPKNSCGAVYEVSLDDNYNGTKMSAIVTGKPLAETDDHADEFYCDPESISNPDNIIYLGKDILLISEDTTKHVNNMSWAYNTKDKTMTRVASLPIGAEVTGTDKGLVGDKAVLMLNAQHPFKDNPKAADGSKPNTALIENATDDQLKAFVGYIDGLPADIFK
jgi:secreted PhoX family phosphatase